MPVGRLARSRSTRFLLSRGKQALIPAGDLKLFTFTTGTRQAADIAKGIRPPCLLEHLIPDLTAKFTRQ